MPSFSSSSSSHDQLDAQLFVEQFFPGAPAGAAQGLARGDLVSIVAALGTPAAGPDDPRDVTRDGAIDAVDAQRVAAQLVAVP